MTAATEITLSPEAARRLAAVYDLLIRLAEKREKQNQEKTTSETTEQERRR